MYACCSSSRIRTYKQSEKPFSTGRHTSSHSNLNSCKNSQVCAYSLVCATHSIMLAQQCKSYIDERSVRARAYNSYSLIAFSWFTTMCVCKFVYMRTYICFYLNYIYRMIMRIYILVSVLSAAFFHPNKVCLVCILHAYAGYRAPNWVVRKSFIGYTMWILWRTFSIPLLFWSMQRCCISAFSGI